MVAATEQIRIRVPARRVKKVRGILSRMGTDVDNVVNMVLAQIELQGRLPMSFEIPVGEKPNATTLAAIEEVEAGKGLSCANWDKFMETLSGDED